MGKKKTVDWNACAEKLYEMPEAKHVRERMELYCKEEQMPERCGVCELCDKYMWRCAIANVDPSFGKHPNCPIRSLEQHDREVVTRVLKKLHLQAEAYKRNKFDNDFETDGFRNGVEVMQGILDTIAYDFGINPKDVKVKL